MRVLFARGVGPACCLQAVCTKVLAHLHRVLARRVAYSHKALADTGPCLQVRAVLFASHYSYHFYVEQEVPHTKVLLWVYGEQLRAVLDNVVLAAYHCRYDWRTHKVTEIRDGVFYPTRFASPQGMLIPLNPRESLVLYRPTPPRRPAGKRVPRQQLLLFELVRPVASESA